MRLGPEPTYMSFVEFDDFSRFDEWEDYNAVSHWIARSTPHGHSDRRPPTKGRLLDALVSGPPLDDGLLLVEFFTPANLHRATRSSGASAHEMVSRGAHALISYFDASRCLVQTLVAWRFGALPTIPRLGSSSAYPSLVTS